MASIIRGSDGFDSATLGLDAGNLATNGYAYLPNGLIVQWGYSAYNSTSSRTVTFPIAFPSACFSVVLATYNSGDTGGTTYAGIKTAPSTTSFAITNPSSEDGDYWMAIGY